MQQIILFDCSGKIKFLGSKRTIRNYNEYALFLLYFAFEYTRYHRKAGYIASTVLTY